MKLVHRTTIAAAVLASAAFAQDAVIQSDAKMKKLMVELQDLAKAKMEADVAPAMGGIMTVVKNSPYSADQITETTQTLGDGTRIHNEQKTTIARDSQGRVRRETPDRITIWDPVENVTYMLNPKTMSVMQTRVMSRTGYGNRMFSFSGPEGMVGGFPPPPPEAEAHRVVIAGGNVTTDQMVEYKTTQDMAAVKQDIAAAKAGIRVAAPGGKKESLGLQRMEGVAVEGTRDTETIDAGVIGNDRPIQIVNERWYSSELQTDVMAKHVDPRSGEQTTKLTNVRLGEPDATLFQVPAGYKMGALPEMLRKEQ